MNVRGDPKNILVRFQHTYRIHSELSAASVTIEPIDEALYESLASVLVHELERYPASIIRDNLDRVVIGMRLSVQQYIVGAMYYDKTIYIGLDPEKSEAYIPHVRRCFHHEFSSILLHNHYDVFPKAEFEAANPSGFRYDHKYLTGQTGLAEPYDETLGAMGFLTEYSRKSFENDMNMIAEELFVNPTDLLAFSSNHPRLEQKLNGVLDFYRRLSTLFTKDGFVSSIRLYYD